MTVPVRSSAQILSVAGLLGALALAVPAGAGAQTVQNYTCADRTQSGATSASISLTDPPANVTAGQSLTLAAGLTLTLPQAFDLTAEASLVSQIGISTTTFGLQVQIGNTLQVVPAAIVVGDLQTLGLSGETVSAALTFPAINVPSTATGDVTVSMPTAAQYPNSATTTPAEVVFNAVLEQESYLGTPSSSNLACADSSTPAPPAQVVAQIPIVAATGTAKTKATKPTKTTTSTKSNSTKSKGTKAPSTKSAQTAKPASVSTSAGDPSSGLAAAASQSATAVPATVTPAASSAQGDSTGASSTSSAAPPASTSSSAAAATPAATGTPASVTIPPRTAGRGTFIPTWELILMGSIIPIAAVIYAWRMRRTYTAARINLRESRTRT